MEEGWARKVVRTEYTYFSTGCKGRPEVQQRFNGVESLVLRDLARQASCIIEEL